MKQQLLVEPLIKGLQIDVDTREGLVCLTDEHVELAREIKKLCITKEEN